MGRWQGGGEWWCGRDGWDQSSGRGRGVGVGDYRVERVGVGSKEGGGGWRTGGERRG